MPKSEVYNVDCLEALRALPDGAFDLAVCDPPYGRKEHGGKHRSGYVRQKNGTVLYVSDGGYAKKKWDVAPIGDAYFDEILRVSKHQIIWGVNYFDRVFGPGRIVWDKCNGDSDQSDCELAYNSLTSRVDLFRYMWAGMMQGKSITEGYVQQGNKALNEHRIHPTQKPVALYTFLFSEYCKEGWRILDPFLGSGSSRIAAYDLGLDFVGYEIDEEYYRAGCERFDAHASQMSLFTDFPQIDLFAGDAV